MLHRKEILVHKHDSHNEKHSNELEKIQGHRNV